MAGFLIDEDLPRSLTRELRAAGFDYPVGSHAGIVVARFPNELPPATLSAAITAALRELPRGDLHGNLLIIEPGRVRLRRTGP